MGRGGAGCFDCALERITSFRGPTEFLERGPGPIEAFGIELAARDVGFELGERLLGAPQLQVGRAQAAPDFAGRMFVLQRYGGGEVPASTLLTLLLQRDAAELVVRIGLAGIDFDGSGEARDGFGVIAALLVDQAELILRIGIAWIYGGGFQVPAKALARA